MYRERKKNPYFPRTDVPIGLWRVPDQPPIHDHDHDFTEIAIVASGRGMHRFEDDVLPIEAGNLFILPPGCRHAWVETEDLEVINVMIDDLDLLPNIEDLRSLPGFDGLFGHEPTLENQQKGLGRMKLDIGQLKEVIRITERLNRTLHQPKKCPANIVAVQFQYLLSILCDAYAHAPDHDRRIIMRVNHIIRYLEDHIEEQVNCEELAENMYASVATLYRLFRKATGTTPVKYVKGLRLDRACELLRKTDKTVTDIACDVGFQDSNYFSRLFRKEKGVSPLQYRKGGETG